MSLRVKAGELEAGILFTALLIIWRVETRYWRAFIESQDLRLLECLQGIYRCPPRRDIGTGSENARGVTLSLGAIRCVSGTHPPLFSPPKS